jgi:hypothetical protein
MDSPGRLLRPALVLIALFLLIGPALNLIDSPSLSARTAIHALASKGIHLTEREMSQLTEVLTRTFERNRAFDIVLSALALLGGAGTALRRFTAAAVAALAYAAVLTLFVCAAGHVEKWGISALVWATISRLLYLARAGQMTALTYLLYGVVSLLTAWVVAGVAAYYLTRRWLSAKPK